MEQELTLPENLSSHPVFIEGNPKGYSGIDNPDRYTGNIGYRTQIDDK
jgi:hypothetical protein